MGVPARRSAYLRVDSSSEHALRHAGVAISFFMGLLRRYAPRKDKSFIAFVLIRLLFIYSEMIKMVYDM